MPSPFPGVDPYLEGQYYWQDFHTRFVNWWCEAISDALPDHYEARFEEQVEILEVDAGDRYLARPDIVVVGAPEAGQDAADGARSRDQVATLEPTTVLIPTMEEVHTRWIRILHRPSKSLVTALELLSPSNKKGPGRAQYLLKRSHFHNEDVHLVELDLLLDGDRLPMGKPLPPADFYAIVARSDRRPNADVYAWTLRDRLPTIPIPLLKPDRDIFVNLAAVYATTYERGRYARSIDYGGELQLPLNEQNARWVEERAKRARSG